MEEVIIETMNPKGLHPAPGTRVRTRENQEHFRGWRRILIEPFHKFIDFDDMLKAV
jgi:hypothetical protein